MRVKTVPMKLLTIVAEAVLRDRLMSELKALGVSGCTVAEVSGWGSDNVRASEWSGPSVRLETVVSEALADELLEVLSQKFFPSWSVAVWLQDVSVVRAERYAAPRPSGPR
jgi:nitrogen regulatory protein P-II 2